jgi:hypothetical protein
LLLHGNLAAQSLSHLFSFKIGGENNTYARQIATFQDGAFVCLFHPLPFGTDTCDFDPGEGEALFNRLTQSGSVIAKYNADGTFAWMRDIASASSQGIFEEAFYIAVDQQENIWVTGLFTDSLDFDPGTGKRMLRTKNPTNPDADQAVYVSFYRGNGDFLSVFEIAGLSRADDAFLRPFTLEAAGDGNIFLCGQVLGNADFDPGAGVVTTPQGITTLSGTVFIAVYNTALNLVRVDFIGTKNTVNSGGAVQPVDLKVDQVGNLYLLGLLDMGGDRDYNPGAGDLRLSAKGTDDGLILKFSPERDYLWGGTFGSGSFEDSKIDLSVAIALDEQGNLYLGGASRSGFDADLVPADAVTYQLDRGGDFIVKYDTGGRVVWAKTYTDCRVGKSNSGRIYGLEYRSGKLYACGSYTCDNDFDPDPANSNVINSEAGEDAFIFFCDTSGRLTGLNTFSGPGNEGATGILAGPENLVTVQGYLRQFISPSGGESAQPAVDLDPGEGVALLKGFSFNSGSCFQVRYAESTGAIFPGVKNEKKAFRVLRASNGILEIMHDDNKVISDGALQVYDNPGRLLKQVWVDQLNQGSTVVAEGIPGGLIIVRFSAGDSVGALVWMDHLINN